MSLQPFTVVPASRAFGTVDPAGDMDNTSLELAAMNGSFNLLNSAFGSSPSTAAGSQLNAAQAALPSEGGTITIPPGAWTLDEQVALNVSQVIFKGFGWSSQLLFSGSGLGTAFKMADTTQRRVSFENLRITQTDGAADGTAVDMSYIIDSWMTGCLVDGSTHAPNIAVALNAAGSYYNVIERNRLNAAGSGGACVYIDNGANSNRVVHNRLIGDSSTTGVHANANGLTIIHPDMESTGLAGVAVGASGLNVSIIDAYLQNLTSAITLASGCGPVTIDGGDADGSTNDITDSGCVQLAVVGFRGASGQMLTYFGGSASSGAKQLGFAASGAAPDVWLYRKATTTLECTGSFSVTTNHRVGGLIIIDAALSSLGSGASQGIEIENAATPPPNTPTGGGVLYAASGALLWKGSSGTVTTIASA